MLMALAIPPHLYVQEGYNLYIFLPLLAIPMGVKPLRTVLTHTEKPVLNQALIQTGQFLAIFSLLLAFGIVLDRA